MNKLKIFRQCLFLSMIVIVSVSDNLAQYALKAQYSDTQWSEFVTFADFNRNGRIETFEPYKSFSERRIIRREWNGFVYEILDTLKYYGLPWAAGDINGNGLLDIAVQTGDSGFGGNGYLQIWEQRHATDMPNRMIAQLTFPERKVLYFAQYVDINKDGQYELLMSPNGFLIGAINVYRWNNNSLKLMWSSGNTNELNKKAIGDFNNNGQMEIAFGDPNWYDYSSVEPQNIEIVPGVYNISPINVAGKNTSDENIGNARVRIFEYVNDTSYAEIWNYDCPWITYTTCPSFSLNFNGDNKEEFVSSFSTSDPSGGRFAYLLFGYKNGAYKLLYDIGEPTGNTGLTLGLAGDFDQDGNDEFIASNQPFTRVYDFENEGVKDEWTYTQLWDSTGLGYYTYDFNENGYPDLYLVFFSKFWRVHIYESIYAPTAVETRKCNIIPASPTLFQNYPNPFNAITYINYLLRKDDDVYLEIYTILGQKMATLVKEKQPAGNHRVTFDTAILPSGIYFYRLRAGNFTATKKMIILK